jgi:hypothetical protein
MPEAMKERLMPRHNDPSDQRRVPQQMWTGAMGFERMLVTAPWTRLARVSYWPVVFVARTLKRLREVGSARLPTLWDRPAAVRI